MDDRRDNKCANDDAALCRALAEAAALRKELGERDIERVNLKAQVEHLRGELDETKLSCAEMKATLAQQNARTAELHRRLVLSEQLRHNNTSPAKKRMPVSSNDRVKRKIFNEKLNSLAKTHARTTAHMLNVQKRCFEDELEALEGEAKASIRAFEHHIAELQHQVHAISTEKYHAENAAKNRHHLLLQVVKQRDALHAQSSSYSNTLLRKNVVIDQLQAQLDTTLAQLKDIRLGNTTSNITTPNPVINLAGATQPKVDSYHPENKRQLPSLHSSPPAADKAATIGPILTRANA